MVSRYFSLLLSFLLLFPINAWSERPKDKELTGTIEGIDLKDEKTTITHKQVRDNTIAKLDALVKSMDNLALGTLKPVPAFDEYELDYLSAVSLYCTMQSGLCAMVLQTLFEVDLINAEIAQKTSCPHLTKYWKLWVAGDMERRVEYRIKVGQFTKVQKFKKHARPKYIKCRDTIEKVRERSPNGAQFFAKRYGVDSSQKKVVKKTALYLRKLRDKDINVYYRTGLK